MTNAPWTHGPIPGVETPLATAPETLAAYARDFGGIVEATPAAVLRPRDGAEVAAALKHCHERGIAAVARAYGQSGNGQCLGRDALVIDLAGLSAIERVDGDAIVAGAGAQWIDLLRVCAPQGHTCPVFTNHTQVSLGGSLAFGGAGAQSHRHGLQIDHVAELEVALVTGELVRCSRRERADLFDAVLGGLGQFGFVTKVTLQPVKAPREVAVANLYYDDFRSMTEDLEDLARQNRFDSLDNYVLPGDPPLRTTEIGLFVYDDQPVPDLAPLLAGARGNAGNFRTMSYEAYVLRNKDLVAGLTGEDMGPMRKPWVTIFLHPSRAIEFAERHMMDLVTHEAGTVVFLVQPINVRHTRSTSFTVPRDAHGWMTGLGVVRVVPEEGVDEALRVNRGILDATIAASGTIYPYGSFPLEPADWAALHGDGFAAYAARKRTYDPKGILNPSIGVGRAALAAGAR